MQVDLVCADLTPSLSSGRFDLLLRTYTAPKWNIVTSDLYRAEVEHCHDDVNTAASMRYGIIRRRADGTS